MNWEWHWHPDPGVIEGLVVLTVLYLLAMHYLRPAGSVFARWRQACFHLGTFLVFLAVATPLDELSEQYLFTAHMFQHVILIYPVPVLWLLGTPPWMIQPFLDMDWSAPLLRFFSRPVAALLTFNLVFYAWHVPALYEWALRDGKIHFLEHATFMAVALLQWLPLIRPIHKIHYAGQLIYLLAGAILQFPLFFLLAFMNRCYYPTYIGAPRVIKGFTAIMDQQTGAILMKLAAMAVMFVSLVVIFGRWYYSEQSGGKRSGAAAASLS